MSVFLHRGQYENGRGKQHLGRDPSPLETLCVLCELGLHYPSLNRRGASYNWSARAESGLPPYRAGFSERLGVATVQVDAAFQRCKIPFEALKGPIPRKRPCRPGRHSKVAGRLEGVGGLHRTEARPRAHPIRKQRVHQTNERETALSVRKRRWARPVYPDSPDPWSPS